MLKNELPLNSDIKQLKLEQLLKDWDSGKILNKQTPPQLLNILAEKFPTESSITLNFGSFLILNSQFSMDNDLTKAVESNWLYKYATTEAYIDKQGDNFQTTLLKKDSDPQIKIIKGV